MEDYKFFKRGFHACLICTICTTTFTDPVVDFFLSVNFLSNVGHRSFVMIVPLFYEVWLSQMALTATVHRLRISNIESGIFSKTSEVFKRRRTYIFYNGLFIRAVNFFCAVLPSVLRTENTRVQYDSNRVSLKVIARI